MGHHFGVDTTDINQSIRQYVPANNRSQLLHSGSNKVYLDAYNANPTSMEAALHHFKKTETPNKVLILGDMFELGGQSKAEHSKLLGLVTELGFPEVILVGPEFMAVAGSAYANTFRDWSEALEWLKENQLHNSSVLVKGSRGMELEKLVEAI